jgi:monovalent cation:H+ antiporter-2, CPA2 family
MAAFSLLISHLLKMKTVLLFMFSLFVVDQRILVNAFTYPAAVTWPPSLRHSVYHASRSAKRSSRVIQFSVLDAEVIPQEDPSVPKRRLTKRVRSWMAQLLCWQVSQRRSLLVTAALAFSLLFGTQPLAHHFSQSPAAEVNRVAPHRSIPKSGTSSVNKDVLSYMRRGGGSTKDKRRSAHGNRNEFVTEMRQIEQKMEHTVVEAGAQTSRTFLGACVDLQRYMSGPKSDTLLLLLATALITPICKRVSLSPILGFLASGMIMGPNGFGAISGIHTTETLAELGIVFFLFEMGIELSFERLMSMRRDVFGLGFAQFMTTALAVAGVGKLVGLPANALVVLGGGLALSSSAFVLQLLKDKNQLATRFGKASFGVLLFQDLAVVPLLVVTPILAGSGAGLATALSSALVKTVMALTSIAFAGRVILNPLFKTVAAAQSQEAFLGVVLLTVLSMSFMTEGLGLSNTLGAFLAGVLLSETKYRYQVEADIAPFRGILLGLFFVTVGFEIDVKLIASNLPLVGSLVFGIMAMKAVVTTLLSLAFGLSLSTSQQTGLILSQGGEFAFVAFGLARSLGILDAPTTKLMLTSVSLTMALTPLMSSLGGRIAKQLEEKSDFTHYLGQDRDANEIKESDDFTVVIGYGAVGKVVCDLLDRKFIRYVGLEVDPNKAIQARNKGLPVFYGDVGRQEVAEAFNVGNANAIVVCIADKAQTNRVLIALRRWYPDLPIFARAANADHAARLQETLNVAAMVPILPMDNLLLTLPFGAAVMKSLGVPAEEVNAIVESKRKEVLQIRGTNRELEELELLQLGISSSSFSNITNSAVVSEESMDDAERYEMTTEAAYERRKAVEGKSPFVARVIQEVCPESADDDDELKTCMSPDQIQLLVDTAQLDVDVTTLVNNRTLAASISDTD